MCWPAFASDAWRRVSYASWIRENRSRIHRAKRFFGLDTEPKLPETPWPDKFHRYCPEHLEKLNWLLCPKGHESSVWIVKDEETGEVIDVCRDNDGTQQWKGFAPRH